MKKIILLLSIVFLLYGCNSSKDIEQQIVKVGNIQFNINKKFILTDIKNNDNKIDILYSYKFDDNKEISPSIIIGKYKETYPNNKEEFINIIIDKIQKNIAGSNIININEFKKGDIVIKSIEYKVNDNLFDEKKGNIYYGIQYYIFDKKNIYLISYISTDKDNLESFKENIKNLQLIK